MIHRVRQWLSGASDRELLATFDALPTATLQALAICAYAVVAERTLYQRPASQTGPLLGADAL